MKRIQIVMLLAALLAWAAPAQAQLIFRKAARPNPSQRVPELILTLKTDSDERKRQHAVEELRDFDAAAYSEIVPVLVDALQNDKKMSVRAEAAASLGRIRPIHPMAAPALEKAAHGDESWRVRWLAKSSLAKLNVAGLLSKKADTTARKQEEPALLDGATPPQTIVVQPTPAPPGPLVVVTPSNTASIPRPLPRNVIPPTVSPPPAPPAAAPPVQGPALFP